MLYKAEKFLVKNVKRVFGYLNGTPTHKSHLKFDRSQLIMLLTLFKDPGFPGNKEDCKS